MREFLKGLDFDPEMIDTIMAEHGKLMTRSKEAVESLKEQLRASQDGLTAANAEIESYRGMDIEGVKTAASEWEKKYKKLEKESADRISDMEYNGALKDQLSGVAFNSEYDRQGIFNEIKAKKLPLENGKIIGLDDVMKTYRETSPQSFKPEKPPAGFIADAAGHAPLTPSTPTDKDAAKAAAAKAFGVVQPTT